MADLEECGTARDERELPEELPADSASENQDGLKKECLENLAENCPDTTDVNDMSSKLESLEVDSAKHGSCSDVAAEVSETVKVDDLASVSDVVGDVISTEQAENMDLKSPVIGEIVEELADKNVTSDQQKNTSDVLAEKKPLNEIPCDTEGTNPVEDTNTVLSKLTKTEETTARVAGVASGTAAPPRRKGYQESRRYDRDRRDNWRKTDKKNESSRDNSACAVNQPVKLSETTAQADASAKTSAQAESSDKITAQVESCDKTPTLVESSDKTPAQVESSDKTPAQAELSDKTLVEAESSNNTPALAESSDKAPSENETCDKRLAQADTSDAKPSQDAAPDKAAVPTDASTKPSKTSSQAGLRVKEEKYEGVRQSGSGLGAKYKDGRHRSDSGGKKDSKGAADIKTKEKDRTDADSGAQLLNLLQKPSPSSKSSDKRDRDKGRGGSGSRSGGRVSGEDLRGRGKSALDLEAQWQKEEDEKKKRETEKRKKEEEAMRKAEEEKRLKEEQMRKEEEEKRKAEEEAERLVQEEQRLLDEYIAEIEERIHFKKMLKQQNKTAVESRGDEINFGKLDSSLKKNTGFVKKLRNLTEGQRDSLMKEFNGLNLSKYVGEAAAALVEAKLKMSDVNCALQLCSAMHRRYADFSSTLLENWQKVLLNKKDEKVPNPSKLRVDLRLFADLIAVGVFTEKEGLGVLANQLTLLVTNDKEDHKNLSILLSFCRHCGDDYAGILPRKQRLVAEKYNKHIPRSQVLPAERQKACSKLLRDYFSSLCKHLEKDHKDLRAMEKQNRKILQTKGELSEERQAKQETASQTFSKLHTNSALLADLLDESLPDLPEEEIKVDPDTMGLDLYSPSKASEYTYDGDNSLFEDEDTRQFYENLQDLKSVIPGILYKDSEQSGAPGSQQNETIEEDDIKVEDVEMELERGLDKDTEADKTSTEGKSEDASSDTEDQEVLSGDMEEEEQEAGSSMKVLVENFLANLSNCVNRELIDKAAIEFCMSLNTKLNRKKLVRALFTVHRTRYDLLPFYSRLVATLCPCMPDVPADLVNLLKGDFRWHIRKKDQINIESKLKSVRYVGELVKFKMFPKADCLHFLKLLLADFSHHNIEMACSLLETCGRYLYRSPDSHHRTKVYLEVMLRKKTALHLDSRYATLIENAYYYSNPPTFKSESRPQRPPMHQYIRKLLYKDLNKLTVEKVLRQMRKLTWDDDEIRAYATKCLVGVWNIRYSVVHCCANLLAGLAPYHESVAIQVVDGVLEDIRLGMEVNLPKMNQRRISMVKYLGELYNYRMVESNVIFKTLYSFITFAVTLDDEVPSLLDPPEHLFRVRMVGTLLDTCGQYFDRGSSRKKLDCFLVYFQRYYWFKKKNAIWNENRPFPMEIEYSVQDTLENLRPKLTQCQSYDEACEQAVKLDKEFRAKLVGILPVAEAEDGGLASIQEDEDTEYDLTGADSQEKTDDDDDDDDHDDRRDGRAHSNTLSPSQSQTGADRRTEERDVNKISQDEEVTNEDDVLDSAGEEEHEDQVLVLSGGPKLIKCQEDDDFMTAFDKMITENIQARSQEAVKVTQVDIVVPVHMKSNSQSRSKAIPTLPGLMGSLASSQAADASDGAGDEAETTSASDNTIQFTLMTKRGNKPQFCNLDIPADVSFASKLKEREVAERVEKERMKRMTLDIHERQEEEDYQEMLASLNRPVAPNVNRERRVRYQHPKGAPDADLIFGSNRKR